MQFWFNTTEEHTLLFILLCLSSHFQAIMWTTSGNFLIFIYFTFYVIKWSATGNMVDDFMLLKKKWAVHNIAKCLSTQWSVVMIQNLKLNNKLRKHFIWLNIYNLLGWLGPSTQAPFLLHFLWKIIVMFLVYKKFPRNTSSLISRNYCTTENLLRYNFLIIALKFCHFRKTSIQQWWHAFSSKSRNCTNENILQ